MTQTGCRNGFSQVLILDGDSSLNRLVLETLAQRNARGTVAADLRSARRLLGHCAWTLIFLNPLLAGEDEGPSLLSEIRRHWPETPVILVSERDSSEAALRAIRCGCADYLVKPVCAASLEPILEMYVPHHAAGVLASVEEGSSRQLIIGRSRSLGRVLEAAGRVGPTSAPVLICGESGCGKELVAQLIHASSRRSGGPFIRVNCAALNESLLESELFGHEKGAFTGAVFSHRGRFERAHGGTLLLDEITETPAGFQAKLLRVLEQMCFERVGGSESVRVNVRIVSTTNQDILRLVGEGSFRSDLYYRLAGLRLAVPPLRERMEDLPELIWYFVNQYAPEAGRRIEGIERETLELFEQCRWPGNIRQLRNAVRTALILGRGPLLSVSEAPGLAEELSEGEAFLEVARQADLAGCSLEEVQRRAILATLDQARGNQARAARTLGISDRTLRERIRKYRQADLIAAD